MVVDELMLVSIIIVNYKEYEMTANCLESLESTTYSNYEIIVVDNESDKVRLDELRSRFKQFRFLESQTNLYYSGGNNLGMENAKGDLIILLNNDTVVSPRWLEPLVAAATRQPMAFYQPQILFMDNPSIVNSLGNTINIFGFAFPIGIGKEVHKVEGKLKQVFYCSGACVLASRKVIERVGKLDDMFYNYYEDVNWGWRGQLFGIKSYVIPESVIYHKWGGSYSNSLSSRKFYYLERGRISSLIRNFSLRTILAILPCLLLIDISLGLYSLQKGFFGMKVRATLDVLRHIRMILHQRKSLQSQRIVRDSELLGLISSKMDHPYVNSSPLAKTVIENLSRACARFV